MNECYQRDIWKTAEMINKLWTADARVCPCKPGVNSTPFIALRVPLEGSLSSDLHLSAQHDFPLWGWLVATYIGQTETFKLFELHPVKEG